MRIINILKSRLISHSPLALAHHVTSLCNARCKMCDMWKRSPKHTDDLSREEIFGMLDRAKEAGMVGYIAWGGEPLLREDLPEILQFAKKRKFLTMVVTNGFLLADRCKEIAPLTNLLYVSIDSNSSLHDEMRGVEGILKNAIDGIKSCKREKVKVSINSVISSLNLDAVEGLCELSRELDVPIVFEPMQIVSEHNKHLKATDEELRIAFSKILKYKRAGYRVDSCTQYLQNFSKQKQYVCHTAKCYVTVDAHGNITTCSENKNWGNIKERAFEELFSSIEFKEFCREAEKCNKCDISCVAEVSLIYSLSPRFILDTVKSSL
ncbi:radical SAM/SPASM domain-containing protein [Candidatus Poribacteria bacterium]